MKQLKKENRKISKVADLEGTKKCLDIQQEDDLCLVCDVSVMNSMIQSVRSDECTVKPGLSLCLCVCVCCRLSGCGFLNLLMDHSYKRCDAVQCSAVQCSAVQSRAGSTAGSSPR